MNTRSATARLPPLGLDGLDASWSTLVTTSDHGGTSRTWHVLDTGGESKRGTVLCVHGNPSWSYMWRTLAARLTDWRVIAVDALNMGFSERTGQVLRLEDHVGDLHAVTAACGIEGPVVTVAHDWGGPISLGWVQANRDKVSGVVLMNTGVARPPELRVPPLISIARATVRTTCETTPAFLHGALRMARPQLSRSVYKGYTAPYGSAARRTGIRDFVDDIPVDDQHVSFHSLADVAAGVDDLRDVPSLLLWGAKDMIFSDAFLHDLARRLPRADVQRYADAGHLVMEDTDAGDVIGAWLDARIDTQVDAPALERESSTAGPPFDTTAPAAAPLWSALEARRDDTSAAIVEMDPKDSGTVRRTLGFDQFERRVRVVAAELADAGIGKGARVATLVPPGIDLTVLVYACLRAGITVVAPDAALGLDGLRRSLRSARPDHVISDWRGLALARSLRLPARRWPIKQFSTSPTASIASRLRRDSTAGSEPSIDEPSPADVAAVVFTSGSTGPSKGVVYRHGQLAAQRDVIRAAFDIQDTDRLVVAFAPFAVLAPALGVPSVVPTMDVTAPGTLRARPLAQAAQAIGGTIVFASPAVLATIAETASELDAGEREALAGIRSVATAGAPVSPALQAAIKPVFPNARFVTPYGMTECLPVTVAEFSEISNHGTEDAPGPDQGVCVGRPVDGVDVAILPLDTPTGTRSAPLAQDTLGEVWVRARHASTGYDNLWERDHHAFVDRWHRTGDVGHLDSDRRLWIEGRVDHVIHASTGTLAPVGIELQATSASRVEQAAAVGVGPVGVQQLVVVVSGRSLPSAGVADAATIEAVRAAVDPVVAAVLVAGKLPVDRRHNSKIDRTRVQRWAEAVLRGAARPKL